MIWIKRLNSYGVSNRVILLLFVLSFLSMVAQIVGLGIAAIWLAGYGLFN